MFVSPLSNAPLSHIPDVSVTRVMKCTRQARTGDVVRSRMLRVGCCVALAFVLFRCGDDDGVMDASSPDVGTFDSGSEDSGADAARDDAGDDGGTDDAGNDAGNDDAGNDAGEDTGVDASDDASDAMMSDSGLCEAIEMEYDSLVMSGQRCETPGSCVVLNGHCGVGLGDCYYGASGITQDELDSIAGRWTSAGCTGAVCDCPPPPEMVRCDAGGCLLRF